jgi:hypothetical protein
MHLVGSATATNPEAQEIRYAMVVEGAEEL